MRDALRAAPGLFLALIATACGPGPAPAGALADARMQAADGRLDEAYDALVALDRAHPDDARVALAAGEIATWRGLHDEGLAWMRRAAARAPEDPEPHLRAAYVLLVHPPAGEPEADGALAEAAEALSDAGGEESADYRACRGEAAFVTGDSDAAERWFRATLELDPECRWALQRLLQLVAGRDDDATTERQELNVRLTALLEAARAGHGMENARMPISFCGH